MEYIIIKNAIKGETVLDCLRRNGYADRTETVCGGAGICKKCRLKVHYGADTPMSDEKKALGAEAISQGIRLACMARVGADRLELELPAKSGMKIETGSAVENSDNIPHTDGYGLAVDIGTTTLALYLYDYKNKRITATYAAENPQRIYGSDVVTRMSAISENPSALEIMRDMVYDKINGFLSDSKIPQDKIVRSIICGNTVMEHIAAGLDVTGMAKMPFTPSSLFGDIRQTPLAVKDGLVYFAPCVSSYVGGDILAGLVAVSADVTDKTVLFADLGTNGEMALVHKGKIITASAAAGPAFEGAGIECGTASYDGAVDSVRYENGEFVCGTINNIKPCGICGSGLIDAASALLESGMLDETGRLTVDKCVLCPKENIYITQSDIRQIQLAKAAVAAGITLLMKKSGVCTEDIDAVYLAGGLGRGINPASARKIGLVAPVPEQRIISSGNTSLLGGLKYLTDAGMQKRLERLYGITENIELSCDSEFNELYIDNMYFGEMN